MKQLTAFLSDGEKIEHDIKAWELRGNCLTFVTTADETVGIPLANIKKFIIIDKERDINID